VLFSDGLHGGSGHIPTAAELLSNLSNHYVFLLDAPIDYPTSANNRAPSPEQPKSIEILQLVL
jgi:hypothetical protein